ncbi:MAG TPA: peptidoglycan DD-metalloendopeptidase family protein [Acidimicrobiales bacterium]|nr:peptidoglycan DD-metalloendopeptidase family protein [Acidimicrobiales bacterium]
MVTPSRNRGVVALALTLIFVSAGAVATGHPSAAFAEDDLAGAQQRANKAAQELADAENEIDKAEKAVNTAKDRASQVEARVGSLRDQVGQLALRRYVEGTKPLSRIFGLADANEVVRAQQFAQVVAGSANDSVRRYKAEREDLQDELAVLDRQKEEQADAVANLRKRRSAALSEVEKLTRLAQEKQAQAAREAQRNQAQAAPAPAARGSAAAPALAPAAGAAAPLAPIVSTGDWICPVAGPHAFSNDYGNARGGGRSHEGNDILASRGTPIVASVSGSVRHHNASLGGRSYYLDGDDGVQYFGTHMDAYGASGQVSAGTVVGYVGDDGDAKGTPHLHFEMHPGGGGPINPYPTLSKYC